MAERAVPGPEVWAAARRRETGRDAARDAAVMGMPTNVYEVSPFETLARIARAQPERPVFRDRGKTLSYGMFWNLVVSLRAVLETARAPDGPVAILATQRVTQIAALFACMGAGRTSTVLDPEMPAELWRATLRTVRPAILAMDAPALASCVMTGDLPAGAVRLVLDGTPPGASGLMSCGPALLAMDMPGFILPTSGSTGQPKLVVHSQRSLAYIARLFTLGVGPCDHYVSAGGAPGSYSSIKYMLATMFSGASMHFADLRKEGYRHFLERLTHDRTSVLRTGASLLRLIALLANVPEALAGLRHLRLGGEPTTQADLDLICRLLPPDCMIHNTYGATECIGTHFSTRAADAPRAGAVFAPAGLPAGFIYLGGELAIVDENMALCPAGAVGEIAIRSHSNALGEWVDGRLVPGRLIADPSAPGTRVYFTGDLGRASDDGTVVVLGRMDRMLKINGQRVEVMEVEAAIRILADVADVTVLPRTMGQSVSLVAFVVARPGLDVNARDLRESLRGQLPAYMLPSRIVVLEALPRLASGKVDGVALLAGLG